MVPFSLICILLMTSQEGCSFMFLGHFCFYFFILPLHTLCNFFLMLWIFKIILTLGIIGNYSCGSNTYETKPHILFVLGYFRKHRNWYLKTKVPWISMAFMTPAFYSISSANWPGQVTTASGGSGQGCSCACSGNGGALMESGCSW